MQSDTVIWIGIDVGKAAHHATAVDINGQLLWSQRVTNAQAALEGLVRRAAAGLTPVQWAVDLTSPAATLLLAVLAAAGQQTVYVPGKTVNRMAGAFAGESKTDAKDARIIAETARLRRDLSTVSPTDELVTELSVLIAHRDDLMADWNRGISRLRELLTAVFPTLERALDYSTRSALILVCRFQTPRAIREVSAEHIAAYLREQRADSKVINKIVAKAVEAADAQTIAVSGQDAIAKVVALQAQRLLGLLAEIKATDKTITTRFRTHRQATIIESLPGFGPYLGALFLVSIGGSTANFRDCGSLAAYAGLAPVANDSGKRVGNMRRPRNYHRSLRKTFYMAAMSTLRTTGLSRQFYDRKRSEGQAHNQAMIALARRLTSVLWALLRDNRTFTADTPPPNAAAPA